MHSPRHRAQRTRSRLPRAAVSVLALAVAGGLGQTAYADGLPGDGHGGPHSVFAGAGHHPHTPVTLAPSSTVGTSHSGTSGTGTDPNATDPDGTGPDGSDPDGTDADGQTGAATNGGAALAGDAGLSLGQLTPTPAPLTAYELPFPCGQTWTGSTHVGHTPSIRAVDWNSPGDFGQPVVAAAAGTVVTAVVGMDRGSYGQYVVVDHGNGESTLYGHLNSVLVTVGQQVDMGTQLGTLGTTGNSTGPHLHFEERFDGSVVDSWFHGAKYAMDTPTTSQNCGTPAFVPVVPLAGDVFGSRAAETMTFEQTTPASFHITSTTGADEIVTLGAAADLPVLGDWNGDGRLDVGVRSPSTRTFDLHVPGKDWRIRFGRPRDLPLAGNWDGSGRWQVGVRRADSGTFRLRMSPGHITTIHLGDAHDIPVVGDWNGDGVSDLGVYDNRTATYTLLTFMPDGSRSITKVRFGTPGTHDVLPVVGDWDGNGTTDLGTWNPISKSIYERRSFSPIVAREHVQRVAVGR